MSRKHSAPVKAKILPVQPFFDIIQQAYRVFVYPKPKSIGVCEGCCMDARIEADFFNPDIEELPLNYVQDWYFAAYDPEGVTKETWAYLLPRVLEILAANEDVSNVGLEISLNRFETGNSENWSKKEWKILDTFQKMYLKEKIARGNDALDDVVCMFALAGWPLDDLLDQVSATSDAVLAQRLWNDWCSGCVPGRESIWITAFWKIPDNSTVFDFYTSRKLYDRMEALALDDDIEAELAARASAVATIIDENANY